MTEDLLKMVGEFHERYPEKPGPWMKEECRRPSEDEAGLPRRWRLGELNYHVTVAFLSRQHEGRELGRDQYYFDANPSVGNWPDEEVDGP